MTAYLLEDIRNTNGASAVLVGRKEICGALLNDHETEALPLLPSHIWTGMLTNGVSAYAAVMRLRIVAASLLLAALVGAQPEAHLAVKTTSGTYTGLVNSTVPDVNQWLGIPFGRPPLGA